MTETKTTARHRPVELGRYLTDGGTTRVLVGRRGADGVVRVFDLALADNGTRERGYYVEAGFDSKAELAVFAKLYLADARRIGDSPMSRAAIEQLIDAAMEPIREAMS